MTQRSIPMSLACVPAGSPRRLRTPGKHTPLLHCRSRRE